MMNRDPTDVAPKEGEGVVVSGELQDEAIEEDVVVVEVDEGTGTNGLAAAEEVEEEEVKVRVKAHLNQVVVVVVLKGEATVAPSLCSRTVKNNLHQSLNDQIGERAVVGGEAMEDAAAHRKQRPRQALLLLQREVRSYFKGT